jgi:cytochrome b561
MSYTRVAIVLHWVIAALIVAVLAIGLVMSEEGLVPDTLRFSLYQWHKSIGITILLLSLARLWWRLTHKAPPMPEAAKPWERLVAKVTHGLFYVLMIGLPLGGWVIVSASTLGIPTVLYGLVPWPHLPMPESVELRKTIGDAVGEAHETGAYFLMLLIGLHVGAALKHHFWDKDEVLARMVPWVRKS